MIVRERSFVTNTERFFKLDDPMNKFQEEQHRWFFAKRADTSHRTFSIVENGEPLIEIDGPLSVFFKLIGYNPTIDAYEMYGEYIRKPK